MQTVDTVPPAIYSGVIETYDVLQVTYLNAYNNAGE